MNGSNETFKNMFYPVIFAITNKQMDESIYLKFFQYFEFVIAMQIMEICRLIVLWKHRLSTIAINNLLTQMVSDVLLL